MRIAYQRCAKSGRLLTAACICLALVSANRRSLGQGYDAWSKVEAAEETRVYSERHAEGSFDDAQKAVVERTILPQLEKPKNRSTLPQVRQRMRDILTRGTTNPKIFDAANKVTADFMMSQFVMNDSKELVIRVNAVILIGDLEAADQKAWPGSIEPLAKAAGESDLPLAVRIAAMSGLTRQIKDGRSSEPAFAKAVAPVVTAIVTKPPTGDVHAAAWMLGRALDMVPVVGATPELVAAAAGILADAKSDLDVRIRAAMALGRVVKPDDTPALATAAGHIRSLAEKSLGDDIAQADARRFAKQLSGGPNDAAPGAAMEVTTAVPPPPGGGILGGGVFEGVPADAGGEGMLGPPVPQDPSAVPASACHRNAWRLIALADAIQPEASKTSGILSVLTGDAAAEAVALATVLRAQGSAIEAAPYEESLKTALAAIEAVAKTAPAAPPAKGGDPATPATDSPFGAGADEGSPF